MYNTWYKLVHSQALSPREKTHFLISYNSLLTVIGKKSDVLQAEGRGFEPLNSHQKPHRNVGLFFDPYV